jgi:hypothetical protein
MSSQTSTGWRDDVVAHGHGDHDTIPPGVERNAIDAVRFLAADAVERAGSGHPGTAMALAPLATRLYTRWMRHDPAAPDWFDRDRLVLSIGHASMLQYAALHLSGYDVTLDDLRSFRRLGSRTPGHPERGHTPGIEVTTGPLGRRFRPCGGHDRRGRARGSIRVDGVRPGLDPASVPDVGRGSQARRADLHHGRGEAVLLRVAAHRRASGRAGFRLD